MTTRPLELPAQAETGIAGLDKILQGGLPRYRSYLIQGQTATGKTTLALQFLLAGVQRGETTLYFTLSETADELQHVAATHGWSLTGIHIHELTPILVAQGTARQTVFPAAEVELSDVTAEIRQMLEQIRPDRVVFDSITELRLLATTPLRYRQQLLDLRQQLFEFKCTTLFLSNDLLEESDLTIDTLVYGILTLSRLTPSYGGTRRRLEVTKLRGMAYAEGYHDFRIQTGGLEVYPRLQAESTQEHPAWEVLSSGVVALDALVGGGLETGTACLITGQAGTGKTTVAMLYAYAAIQRAEAVAVFLFDERMETWYHRAASLGMDLRTPVLQGRLHVRYVGTGEISAGEFAHLIRQMVETEGIKVLVLDSLSGYLNAMPEEKLVLNQMHEMLTYLGQCGVLTLMVVTQHGLLNSHDPLDLSYLADTVLLLRHFEAAGSVRQAISVLKKRYAAHERSIRELSIAARGVQVGPPLVAFRGVLTGTPQYEGSQHHLLLMEHQPEPASSLPDEVSGGG